MTPELAVKITADIDLLRDNFRKAVVNVKGFDRDTRAALSSVDKGFANLANDIDKDMSRASNSVHRASSSITKSLANQAVATSKSRNTYLEFGRVLQDLPYGFTGIQNNLTQLVPAAGLAGLAFTALISAITFASIGTDNWTRGLGKNKTALDAVSLSGSEYLETLTQINQVRLKGEQDATKEIAELKVLYGAYQNANLPLKVRQEAYKDLQEQYPAYFKNIKFEQEASAKTKMAYDSLTQAILATGRARAAVDLIAKNESRKLENEQKGIDLERERLKLIAQRDALQKRAEQDLKNSTREGAGLGDISRADSLQGKINDNLEKQNNLKTDSNLLDANNLQLIKSVNVELTKGAEIIGTVGALAKANFLYVSKFAGKTLEAINSVNVVGDRLRANPFKQFNDADVDFSKAKITPNEGLKQYQRDAQAAYEASLKLDESLNNILNSGVTSSLSSAFASLGTSIANGGNAMEAVGQSLLSSLGGVMVQLGELAIATGVGIKSIKLALKSLNPALAIGAGVALIALGSFFKAKASSIGDGVGGGSSSKQSNRIPGFATGVDNFGGGLAMVGERGRELVSLPTGSSVMSNSRTEQVLSANKGSQNIQVFGEVGFDMDKFVIRFKRAEKLLNRQGAFG